MLVNDVFAYIGQHYLYYQTGVRVHIVVLYEQKKLHLTKVVSYKEFYKYT